MSSRDSWPSCQPRYATPRRPERRTLGGEVNAISRALGKPLLPWQRHVADVALEVDPQTGRLAYRRVVLTVPRQSGKTTLQLALFMHRMVAPRWQGPQVAMYAAQNGLDARNKLKREWNPMLEQSPAYRDTYETSWVTGAEALLFNNGSRLQVSAGTEKSGHGQTLDLAVVDEAFAQVDGRLEQAFSPAMMTRPQPQLWFVSTAGKPSDIWFRDKVEQGRLVVDDADAGIAFFEWSAPDDADPGSRDEWWRCMPALGHGNVTERVIAAEYLAMPTDEFRRAYLNQWVGEASSIFPHWSDLAVHDDQRPAAPAFAVETTQDQAWTAISVAGARPDGRMQVEVADYRPGSTWAVARIVELQQRWGSWPVVIDPREPAGALISDLEAAGVTVVKPSAQDVAHACASFYNAVIDRTLVHHGDVELGAALKVARQRPLSDSWAWDRKTGNVAALFAATLAAWGASRGLDVSESVW